MVTVCIFICLVAVAGLLLLLIRLAHRRRVNRRAIQATQQFLAEQRAAALARAVGKDRYGRSLSTSNSMSAPSSSVRRVEVTTVADIKPVYVDVPEPDYSPGLLAMELAAIESADTSSSFDSGSSYDTSSSNDSSFSGGDGGCSGGAGASGDW